jgi:hypothetical protein
MSRAGTSTVLAMVLIVTGGGSPRALLYGPYHRVAARRLVWRLAGTM